MTFCLYILAQSPWWVVHASRISVKAGRWMELWLLRKKSVIPFLQSDDDKAWRNVGISIKGEFFGSMLLFPKLVKPSSVILLENLYVPSLIWVPDLLISESSGGLSNFWTSSQDLCSSTISRLRPTVSFYLQLGFECWLWLSRISSWRLQAKTADALSSFWLNERDSYFVHLWFLSGGSPLNTSSRDWGGKSQPCTELVQSCIGICNQHKYWEAECSGQALFGHLDKRVL